MRWWLLLLLLLLMMMMMLLWWWWLRLRRGHVHRGRSGSGLLNRAEITKIVVVV